MKTYRVDVQRIIIETFEISAENEEDARKNYYDGNEVDWEQIENEITKVELKSDYWDRADYNYRRRVNENT
jgi:hypothetical protein|tara:strand:- start:31 stop:243 length:213 start_codon:yes stop_codon:yes gene_type:complete